MTPITNDPGQATKLPLFPLSPLPSLPSTISLYIQNSPVVLCLFLACPGNYGLHRDQVSQANMEASIDAIVAKTWTVAGKHNVSLQEVGYVVVVAVVVASSFFADNTHLNPRPYP